MVTPLDLISRQGRLSETYQNSSVDYRMYDYDQLNPEQQKLRSALESVLIKIQLASRNQLLTKLQKDSLRKYENRIKSIRELYFSRYKNVDSRVIDAVKKINLSVTILSTHFLHGFTGGVDFSEGVRDTFIQLNCTNGLSNIDSIIRSKIEHPYHHYFSELLNIQTWTNQELAKRKFIFSAPMIYRAEIHTTGNDKTIKDCMDMVVGSIVVGYSTGAKIIDQAIKNDAFDEMLSKIQPNEPPRLIVLFAANSDANMLNNEDRVKQMETKNVYVLNITCINDTVLPFAKLAHKLLDTVSKSDIYHQHFAGIQGLTNPTNSRNICNMNTTGNHINSMRDPHFLQSLFGSVSDYYDYISKIQGAKKPIQIENEMNNYNGQPS